MNIHLLWEPLIPLILNKLKCKIAKKYKIDLTTSLEKFQQEKKCQSDTYTIHPHTKH